MDRAKGRTEYVTIPSASTDRDEVRVLGDGLAAFVAAVAAEEGW